MIVFTADQLDFDIDGATAPCVVCGEYRVSVEPITPYCDRFTPIDEAANVVAGRCVCDDCPDPEEARHDD